MGESFFKEIGEFFDGLDRDPEVRVVIIKGEGKSFSAGTDLHEAGALLSGTAADERERTRLKIMELQEGFNWLWRKFTSLHSIRIRAQKTPNPLLFWPINLFQNALFSSSLVQLTKPLREQRVEAISKKSVGFPPLAGLKPRFPAMRDDPPI